MVNFCWVLPASVVQGWLRKLEKLGQGRTSQRDPLSSFSELDSTCLPITAYTVELVLHGRVRSLMSENMKEHEGNAWLTNHALYLVKMTEINSQ